MCRGGNADSERSHSSEAPSRAVPADAAHVLPVSPRPFRTPQCLPAASVCVFVPGGFSHLHSQKQRGPGSRKPSEGLRKPIGGMKAENPGPASQLNTGPAPAWAQASLPSLKNGQATLRGRRPWGWSWGAEKPNHRSPRMKKELKGPRQALRASAGINEDTQGRGTCRSPPRPARPPMALTPALAHFICQAAFPPRRSIRALGHRSTACRKCTFHPLQDTAVREREYTVFCLVGSPSLCAVAQEKVRSDSETNQATSARGRCSEGAGEGRAGASVTGAWRMRKSQPRTRPSRQRLARAKSPKQGQQDRRPWWMERGPQWGVR